MNYKLYSGWVLTIGFIINTIFWVYSQLYHLNIYDMAIYCIILGFILGIAMGTLIFEILLYHKKIEVDNS